MARYDLRLNQIGDDRIISQTRDSVDNAVALFHNDSLFVVWEDYRDSTSSIFGTAIRLHEPAGIVDDASATTGGSLTLSPNPASEQGTIHLALPAKDGAIIQIFDALGHLCLELPVPTGERSLSVPVDRLTSGFFIARLLDGGRTGTVSFMVTR